VERRTRRACCTMQGSGADTKAPHDERHTPMKLHYVVRSVLLSRGSSALTLEKAEWLVESDTETIEIEGEKVPALVEGDPADPSAEVAMGYIGGPKTELRFDGSSEWKPGDYLTITVEPTR
jgi:hypothetical protein